jgi:hypothetical protein
MEQLQSLLSLLNIIESTSSNRTEESSPKKFHLRLLSRTGLSKWEEWEETGFNRLVFDQTVDADDKEKVDEGPNGKNILGVCREGIDWRLSHSACTEDTICCS